MHSIVLSNKTSQFWRLLEWGIRYCYHLPLSDITGLPIVHHDGYVCELPPKHRFPMEKFTKVVDILVNDMVISENKQIVQPKKVSKDIVKLAHTEDYVEKFFNGKTSREEQRVTGFEWTEGLLSRVLYETGGTVLAGRIALERGLSCSTAGGTHHAFPEKGSGFCLFNDLAVATKYFQQTNKVEKTLIIDLDVHQGDGTAVIFANDPSVFTFSMHCEKNFPTRKQESDLDVPLLAGLNDKQYLKILAEHLSEVLDTFRPSLVLYDAGVDVHEDDELGKLDLTDQGIYKRDTYVLNEVIKRGIPIASVIGGGYSENLDELAKRHSILHRAATAVWKQRHL